MLFTRLGLFCALAVLVACMAPLPASADTPRHSFAVQGDHFLLDGKPFIIRSGEMHYPRIPRAYWRDRLRKARAMGLNTICTYIFWNLHEPRPGEFDFSDNLDIAAFARVVQEEGLFLLVRPGPYICTEWDWGGFPAWLGAMQEMRVRSQEPRFLDAARKYLQRVGDELAPLQVTHGGPILMVQVENEYGSFGHDHEYMHAIEQMDRDAGFDVPLYTSDGPGAGMLNGGTLPDALSVVNFGGDDPAGAFNEFDKFRQNVPRMTGEYWIGWFDHWGEQHHTTDAESSVKGVDWMLSHNVSFNLYMFHGGTSFGYMAGANDGGGYEPDISGYDYDSPLDEAGRPTAKFTALHDVIKKHLPADETLPALPSPVKMVTIPRFTLAESASLLGSIGVPLDSPQPLTMEELGQSYGLALYRTTVASAARGALEIHEPHDYAFVFVNGTQVGTLDRRHRQTTLQVDIPAKATLDILVENMGHINFGHALVTDRKGITGSVRLNGQELTHWSCYSLPTSPSSVAAYSPAAKSGPQYFRGSFDLNEIGDTFLDMRGWGKGYVWVNGHNLGRFWHIGPQQTLFVPGVWLKPHKNEVVVLELADTGKHEIAGLTDPVYATSPN